MKKTVPLDAQGIAHLMIPIAVGVVVVVAGVGVYVANAHHSTAANQAATDSHSPAQERSLKATTQQNAPSTTVNVPADAQTVSSAPSTSSTAKTTSTTPTHSTASAPAPSAPASSAPASPTPDTYQEKVSALTALIQGLQNGGSASIPTNPVTVPGPISNAQARPIIFGVKGGGTYFAYTQGSAPNFNQSASSLAGSMAIVSASGSYTTESAHLNKANQLVDANSMGNEVGYSVGGN